MIALLIPFLLIPMLMILPAFFLSQRKPQEESLLLPFVHMPAIILWFLLTVFGIGAQSLANIVELIYLGIAAVTLAYIKVFIIDRRTSQHALTTYGTVAVLLGSVILLRALMPSIPE